MTHSPRLMWVLKAAAGARQSYRSCGGDLKLLDNLLPLAIMYVDAKAIKNCVRCRTMGMGISLLFFLSLCCCCFFFRSCLSASTWLISKSNESKTMREKHFVATVEIDDSWTNLIETTPTAREMASATAESENCHSWNSSGAPSLSAEASSRQLRRGKLKWVM